jgi:hypothetical protein
VRDADPVEEGEQVVLGAEHLGPGHTRTGRRGERLL